jgi:hypothetical protein
MTLDTYRRFLPLQVAVLQGQIPGWYNITGSKRIAAIEQFAFNR